MQIPAHMHGKVYLSTTLAIVIFTTVVFGGLTLQALQKLGLQDFPPEENNVIEGSSHKLMAPSPSSPLSSSRAQYAEVNTGDDMETGSDTGLVSSNNTPLSTPPRTRGRHNGRNNSNNRSHKASSPDPLGHKGNGQGQSGTSDPAARSLLQRFDDDFMKVIFSTPVRFI
jgi:hypothetical protein